MIWGYQGTRILGHLPIGMDGDFDLCLACVVEHVETKTIVRSSEPLIVVPIEIAQICPDNLQ